MKTTALCFTGLFALLLAGCGEKETSLIKDTMKATYKGHSICKLKKSGDISYLSSDHSFSCVAYQYLEAEKLLKLTHINAGFNCCPDTMSATFSQHGDTVFIEEWEDSNPCNCDCLYDMEYELQQVEPGQLVFRFIEPYVGDMEKLYFTIDLSQKIQDTICAVRENYPWGDY